MACLREFAPGLPGTWWQTIRRWEGSKALLAAQGPGEVQTAWGTPSLCWWCTGGVPAGCAAASRLSMRPCGVFSAQFNISPRTAGCTSRGGAECASAQGLQGLPLTWYQYSSLLRRRGSTLLFQPYDTLVLPIDSTLALQIDSTLALQIDSTLAWQIDSTLLALASLIASPSSLVLCCSGAVPCTRPQAQVLYSVQYDV